MRTRFLLITLLSFTGLTLCAQGSQFKAFGHMPDTVPDSLYTKLEKSNTAVERFTVLEQIAAVFLRADMADSLTRYGQSMRLETETNVQLRERRAVALYYVAMGRKQMGLLDMAVAGFLTALNEKALVSLVRHKLLLGLAETYILQKEYDKTLSILTDVVVEDDETLSLWKQCLMAEYYLGIDNLQEATKTIDRAMAGQDNSLPTKLLLRLQLDRARIFLTQENYEQALPILSRINTDALDNGFYDLYINAVIFEGRVYSIQKRYEVAEVVLSTAYANTLQWNRMELRQRLTKALAQLYNATGDYQNAYNLMTQYTAVTQEIAASQNKQIVRDLEVRYETLKKEQQIGDLKEEQLLKQSEITRQKTIKNAILIGFLVVLIPIILLLVVYYQKLQTQSALNAEQQQRNQQEKIAVARQQELELAHNAMAVQTRERHRIARELHDSIGGNLAAMKLQLAHPDSTASQEILLQQMDQTYQQVREISHSLIPQEFSEQSFTALVQEYLDHIDHSAGFSVGFVRFRESELNKTQPYIQQSVLHMIKELVTNAIKHAEATRVELQLGVDPDHNSIQMMYEDDGVGFNVEEKSTGIGFRNLRDRVTSMGATISIDSRPGNGTVVNIEIPQMANA